jgi:hypothetical protein
MNHPWIAEVAGKYFNPGGQIGLGWVARQGPYALPPMHQLLNHMLPHTPCRSGYQNHDRLLFRIRFKSRTFAL